MDWHFLQLLLLIMAANGTPILLRYLMQHRMSCSVDFGYDFFDNRHLFGSSKTWRGLIGSLVVTGLFASLIGYDLKTGFLIAYGAMAGDLLSSFIKRRLGMRPSSCAPLLDQIPESLIPALLVIQQFQLTASEIVYLVIVFFVLEYVLSRLLYALGIRKKPY